MAFCINAVNCYVTIAQYTRDPLKIYFFVGFSSSLKFEFFESKVLCFSNRNVNFVIPTNKIFFFTKTLDLTGP